MRDNRRFVTAALFSWHVVKLSWQQRISDQSKSLSPMHWKMISLNSSKTLQISAQKSKDQPCSLCCENRSITCWSSSGYFRVKRPIVACFADIFSSPERIVAWSLLQRRTMDLLSPYSRAISELFSTTSASVITFILKAILYEEWRALGMMIKNNSDERDTRLIDTLKRLTEVVVVVDLLSCGSI